MALLYYHNLVKHRPDVLMTKAFYGLKGHSDYLTRIKNYMESDEAVLRLAVKEGAVPDSTQPKYKEKAQHDAGTWVQLSEPEDLPNLSEKVFEAFLSNDVIEVYEVPPKDLDNQAKTHQHRKFSFDRKIRVLGRDIETEQLLLERLPKGEILLRPNTYPVVKQLDAIRKLQNEPALAHRPLLRLFEDQGHADWPSASATSGNSFFEGLFSEKESSGRASEWQVLTDPDRPGTSEQRRFVKMALRTPDFALLEGPPGSGKTTAICELILQLVQDGKRVLLCASTHVAVDNVIERLMEEGNPYRHLVIPVRIGDKINVSEKTWCWQLGQFVRTETSRIKKYLSQQSSLTESQSALKQNIQNNSSIIERLVLDSANLVCGTTIGLLQHPDIKKSKGANSPQFDVMIIDEASKTTFHEFLVPALHAKRWILVGDPKQLSPYVDDEEMAVNLTPCLEKKVVRNACVDVFLAKQLSEHKRRTAVVEVTNSGDVEIYQKQAVAHSVPLKEAQADSSLGYASIVVGNRPSLEECEAYLPLDTSTIRSVNDEYFLHAAERRANAYTKRHKLKMDGKPAWEKEIAWRQARVYEQRFAPEKVATDTRKNTVERLNADLEALIPVEGIEGVNPSKVKDAIDSVRRVALPSVLECLRFGFERTSMDRRGSALTDGLPENVMEERRVLLSFQHRMHPEIASFSHQHVYNGEALISPDYMPEKRSWGYEIFGPRSTWLEVKGKPNKANANKAEARAILEELKAFDRWANNNPQTNGPWEVAILCFYRGQERAFQGLLQQWTNNRKSKRYFFKGEKHKPYLTIELCTVDRFQGHEADLVFLSFSNDRATSFLESPNRLNVALTRARYQLVIVGNRQKFKKSNSLVGKLASEGNWSMNYGQD